MSDRRSTDVPPRPSWLPARLFPFADHTVDIAGCTVAYVDEGDGPTLLFVHGNPDYALLWRRQIAALKDRYRCVAVDLPGFGRSKAVAGYGFTPAEHADVVRGLVEALELRGATMIVHDWGGPIGLRAATLAPDRYQRLVLAGIPVGADYRLRQPLWVRAMMVSLGSRVLKGVTVANNLLLEGPLRSEMHRGSDPPDEQTAAAYRGPFDDAGSSLPTWVLAHHQWTATGHAYLTALDDDLDRIAHLPVLLLYGGADRYTSASREVPRLQSRFRTHDTVIIPGAGHFFPESAPDETTEAIRAWLQRTPLRGDRPVDG